MTDFAVVSRSSPFTLPFSDIAGFLAFARERRMAIARIEVLDGSGNLVSYPVAGSPDAPFAIASFLFQFSDCSAQELVASFRYYEQVLAETAAEPGGEAMIWLADT
ncbi:hypothetical protein [Leisingera sp. McT4-56]|uniref:hypothetical protein n=1 Tax=Leisingera sp. McT4-56 TaxID=2881255 RepID=UPI001CF91B31|nr:hypothetical protein [Leisingera sp. McT4-56]MCB4455307.1 hypothetical protein [Leisingera sp. McT4-56]